MTPQGARFSQVQAVLFDLDGTLIDSAPDLAAAADAMRLARGLPSLPLAQYRPMAGAGARGLLGVAFGMTPEHADYDTLREEFFCIYERSLTQRTQIFDGVPELLARFASQGVKWGVVTNKSERFTLPLTGSMALFDTAGAIVSGDTTPFAKPHPAPLLEAARRMGVDASRCVYVGDDERDIVAGLAAGMATVAVTYGYLGAQADTSRWGANATINCVNELLPLLQFSSVA
ncbi:MAG: phosphoglycolate phosphatase [Burkholderiales bacterium RIFOXYC12_FULL_60_6]|nr:MAG: phosphoglycolate phosphatase [Burkholderiales bacterium RIFOXYD12_FULL_59_19]OGB82391.1 MAG: phosphoglycolate phosphatase [Burkholderiales bacterium RIFOXYC12_FULL_60_6]